MARVIQIRDVPEDIHAALTQAARAEGVSLTRFLRHELEHVARRAQAVRDNAAVVRETQAAVGTTVGREAILTTLHEGRCE